jgi:hypothetical protein
MQRQCGMVSQTGRLRSSRGPTMNIFVLMDRSACGVLLFWIRQPFLELLRAKSSCSNGPGPKEISAKEGRRKRERRL